MFAGLQSEQINKTKLFDTPILRDSLVAKRNAENVSELPFPIDRSDITNGTT